MVWNLNYTVANGNVPVGGNIPGFSSQINPIGIELCTTDSGTTATGKVSVASGVPLTGTADLGTAMNIKISATDTFDDAGSVYGVFDISTFFQPIPVSNAVQNLWLNSNGFNNLCFAQVTYSNNVTSDLNTWTLNMSIVIIYSGAQIFYTLNNAAAPSPIYICVFNKYSPSSFCLLDAHKNTGTTITGISGMVPPIDGTTFVIYADAKLDTYAVIPISTFLGAPGQNHQITIPLSTGLNPNCFVAVLDYFFNPSPTYNPLNITLTIKPSNNNACSASIYSAGNPNALTAYRNFYTSPFSARAPVPSSLASVTNAGANQCSVVETDSHTITICKK
jgi:hypothetical protein